MGDINERNIGVEPTRGDVSIMDCDSFQVRDVKSRTIYRCKVGSPNYTAPELLRQMKGRCNKKQCPGGPTVHDVGFPCVIRNQEHDRFGLAVIAFQLLMDEHHPFSCQIIGPDAGVTEVKDKIERGYYPYSSSKPSHIRVGNPEVERRFKKLPKSMKDLFEQAFVRV